MAHQTAPQQQTTEQAQHDAVAEARAIRRRFLEQDAEHADDTSPQAFYERSVARDDVREILKRLAEN